MITDYRLKYLLTTFIFFVKEEGVAVGEKTSSFFPLPFYLWYVGYLQYTTGQVNSYRKRLGIFSWEIFVPARALLLPDLYTLSSAHKMIYKVAPGFVVKTFSRLNLDVSFFIQFGCRWSFV